jgi:hypothetical protein
MTDLSELRRAIELIEAADPEQLRMVEMAKAVQGIDFMDEVRRGVPQPGVGAVDPRNAHVIAAAEASHHAAVERERTARAQTAASRAKIAERLAAGQSPENAHSVRRSVSP